MALSVKLQAKQQQGLTVTPQLAQSIKLLQMNSIELQEHIEQEIEKNPLLELADPTDAYIRGDTKLETVQSESAENTISDQLEVSSSKLEENLGTSVENEFDVDRSGGEAQYKSGDYTNQSGSGSSSAGPVTDSDYNIESFLAGAKTLRDHLSEQLALMRLEDVQRLVSTEIIDSLDEDGYFRRDLQTVSTALGVSLDEVQWALDTVQTLDPVGVGARDLKESLKLQLIEKDRFDPAIEIFIENIHLLAERDFKALAKLCDLDHDDIMDIVDEIRALDPRPAKMFDASPIQQIIPDVLVNSLSDGSFVIELNADAMPKVLVNQTYKSIVDNSKTSTKDDIKYVAECFQNANWLTRSLEQRAQTILKVTSEIVKQQDAFFAFGVKHLKPMSLRQIAEKIDMHESTVSRVTSNKYLLCERGTFELKYFFTTAIQSVGDNEAHSAESVRQEIRQLIDEEEVEKILSDDVLVAILQEKSIDIARRTVAKYRESMGIASSVQRRREKRAMQNRD